MPFTPFTTNGLGAYAPYFVQNDSAINPLYVIIVLFVRRVHFSPPSSKWNENILEPKGYPAEK